MTPAPQRKTTIWEKAQTGLFSLSVILLGKLISVGGGIYENSIIVKNQMEQIINQQHEATLERNNIRLHQVDQDFRLGRIETLLQNDKK